jgi:hypothetical protein
MSMRTARSIPGVCDVELVRGSAAREASPDLLLEVPHGATAAADFAAMRAALRGTFPADLEQFFFVNTDVGAPEVARRVAARVVAQDPARSVLVVRCRIPRTFVDCNRVIDAGAKPAGSPKGELTPGLPPWITEPADAELLLARHRAYRELVTAAYIETCRRGLAMMVHSFAPRSIDVPVDDRIVEHLRAAYEPGALENWPLRPPVDLIADTPSGERLAGPALFDAVRAAFAEAGVEVGVSATYGLHPGTLAHGFALAHPGRTLCVEVRRDLLVREFTPFAEMAADPQKVDAMARPLADAVLAVG